MYHPLDPVGEGGTAAAVIVGGVVSITTVRAVAEAGAKFGVWANAAVTV